MRLRTDAGVLQQAEPPMSPPPAKVVLPTAPAGQKECTQCHAQVSVVDAVLAAL